MVIHVQHTLAKSLDHINFSGKYHGLPLPDLQQPRTHENSDALIELYGQCKWNIVDLLNKNYDADFNLNNWLLQNKHDEVAYFLNETGSNCLNYAQYKIPSQFHLWLGKKGFIIGIEQKGKGFNAQEIDQKKIKENEGAAFAFFHSCKSSIFFDNPDDARIVFMEFRL